MYHLSTMGPPPIRDWSGGRRRKSRGMMGLGALPTAELERLTGAAEAVGRRLDAVRARINDLAASRTLPPSSIAALQDAAAALTEQLAALVTETPDADQVSRWETDLEQLAADVEQLAATVSGLAASAPLAKASRVALWTGAAVAGAIGLGLVIRYYGKRRGR